MENNENGLSSDSYKIEETLADTVILGETDIQTEGNSGETVDNPTKPEEKSEKTKMKLKKGPIMAAAAIMIGVGYLYVTSGGEQVQVQSEKTSSVPVKTNPLKVKAQEDQKENVIRTKRIKVYDKNEVFEHKKQTLTELNKSESYIAIVKELKKEMDNIKKESARKGMSLKDRERFNKSKREALLELNKRLNFGPVSLKNGNIVRPLQGTGYEIETKQGIVTEVKNGSFIKVKEGFLITDTATDTLYLVYSHMVGGSSQQIEKLYKVSSRRGLEDITVDNLESTKARDQKTELNKSILNLINGKSNIETINFQTEKLIKKVLFFNENGIKSGSEDYRIERKSSTTEDTREIKSKRKSILGFRLQDQRVFKKEEGVIKVDGIKKTFDGLSSGLRMVYKVYKGGKQTNDSAYIQIISDSNNGEEVLSEWEVEMVSSVLLKTYYDDVSKTRYIVRNNKLFKIEGLKQEEKFHADGYIIGEVKNGVINKVEVIETTLEVVKEKLSKFNGKTLIGKKGFYLANEENEYKVEEGMVHDKLRERVDKAETLTIYESTITRNSGVRVDLIESIKTTKKVGAKLTTSTRYIYIEKKGEVKIQDRKTGKTTILKDISLYFDKNHLIISKNPIDTWDKEKETINGKIYQKVKELGEGKFLFIDKNGNYLYSVGGDITHYPNKKVILREEVTDIEETNGDLFNFIYFIDEKTGQLKSAKIGTLEVKMKNKSLINAIKKNKKTILKQNQKQEIKNVLTLKEMLGKSPFLFNVTFTMMNGDTVKIVSQNSIMLNGDKLMLKSGRLNKKEKLFIFDLNKDTVSKSAKIRSITGSAKRTTFERTIAKVESDIKDYYTESILVYSTENDIRRVRYRRDIGNGQSVQTWSVVYTSKLNLDDETITLEIEPATNSGKTTEVIVVSLKEVKQMKGSMRIKFEEDYKEYLKSLKAKGTSKSLLKVNNNTKILEEQGKELDAKLAAIMGKNLEYHIEGLTDKEKRKIKEEEERVPEFTFEIGKSFHYKIEKSVEIADGQTKYMAADIKEGYYNDRVGNSLTLNDPKVVLAVTGDFNTNKVIFTPVKMVFTDDIGERRTVAIPQKATILEYQELESDYTLDGVPAFYVNQKVKELPTTVMLSTVAGVLDSLSASDDDIASQLGDIGGLTGGESSSDSESSNPFTDGASEGISAGVKDILDVYKEKSEGKKDILITTGELELKSKFISEVQVQLDSTTKIK